MIFLRLIYPKSNKINQLLDKISIKLLNIISVRLPLPLRVNVPTDLSGFPVPNHRAASAAPVSSIR